MVTKEQFVKRMQLIQNFHSEQDTLATLMEKLTDGYCVPTIGNYLVDEIINIISEDLGIKEKDDWIGWWLYEDVDKFIYDGETKISVKTLEELYDFLVS